MTRPRSSLRRRAIVTMALILLAAAVIAVLIATTVYQTAYQQAARDGGAAATRFFEDRLRHVAQERKEHVLREKTRLEFLRLLEEPAGREERLRSYLTALSESPMYAGLTLCDGGGHTVFRQGPEVACEENSRNTPASSLAATAPRLRYVADIDERLFISLSTDIWLGAAGMGVMHALTPLDHAFLWRNAYPDAELFIEWQGRIVAASAGETGLTRAQAGVSGRIERDGQRYEQRRVPFSDDPETPYLLVQKHIAAPFSVGESIKRTALLFMVIALLAALALRSWLAQLLPRIESLARSAQRYAVDGHPSPALDDLLEQAAGTENDELSDVVHAAKGMIANITLRDQQRLRAEAQLRESERHFRDVAESAGEFIWELDRRGVILSLSPGAAEVFGASVSELVGTRLFDHLPSEDQDVLRPRIVAVTAAAQPFHQFEFRIRQPGGKTRWLSFSGAAVRDEHGEPTGAYHGIAQDITRRKRDEKSLLLAEKVFDNSPQAILITDASARIVAVNPAFTEITGYRADEAIGQDPGKFASGRHDAAFYAGMWRDLKTRGAWAGEVWDRRKSGSPYPKWLTISAVEDAHSGAVTHYVGIFSDITERKQNEARIEYLAYHDPLTDLPNRYALNARLAQSLADARRSSTTLALLFIDLDRFKTINDSLGHDIGDQLLVVVSQRILGALRESDTVARLGGDEFVIVVPGITGPEDAARVAEKVIAAVSAPLVLAGHPLHTSPSIGVALYPTDGSDATTLMKNADTAMYYAKEHGRNTYHFFTAGMNEATGERLLFETQLHHALERDEFVLEFQPQLEIATGRVVGVEALVRWHHPDRGIVAPERFIAIAEEIGLIIPLGAWVLEEACRQAMTWQDGSAAGPRIAVNVSVHQLRDRRLVAHVAETLTRTGLPPERLELEITESAVMLQPDTAVETLRALAALGVRLAIDDFGTGYSSLAYLKRLPNSRLKIDRSFVSDLTTDANDAAITEGILALARSLGLAVTAEGIETPAQLDILKQFGCIEGQGFLFSKPLAPDALRSFLVNGASRLDSGRKSHGLTIVQ